MRTPLSVILTSALLAVLSLLLLPMSLVPMCAPRSTVWVTYAVASVPGVVTAVGLFRLKAWARYIVLCLSASIATVGLFLIFIGTVAEVRAPGDEAGNQALMLWGLLTAAAGGLVFYWFNRAGMKAHFRRSDGKATEGSAAQPAPRRRALALAGAALAVLLIAGVVFASMFSLESQPNPCGIRISQASGRGNSLTAKDSR